MTLNYKVLSLVLLAGVTMGGTFAKKTHHSSDSCEEPTKGSRCPDRIDPFACCDKLCCPDLCKSDCKIDCDKKCEQILCFETGLSFEALLNPPAESGGQTLPPSQLSAPEVCGTLQVCFDKLMRKLCYRITICGAASTANANTQVTSAFLYTVDACTGINSSTTDEKINKPLIPLSPAGDCGSTNEPFCFTGQITMLDLQNAGGTSPETRSIACLYDQALNGNLSVQAFGSSCVSGVSFEEGLVRGTLRPCLPCCSKR